MASNPVYISTNDPVLITDPYVIFYQLVPKTVSWDNTAQISYYMVNSTSSIIPFADGSFYYDANSVLQTSLTAGASLYIDKNNLNNWIQVTTPNDIVSNGSSNITNLPIASSSILGGIKIGSGFSITLDGTLSALAQPVTTIDWIAITGKPNFSTVAVTGVYSDLLNKPTFSTVATTGQYSDLIGKPSL